MTTLKTRDLMALGFMTFALFLGAGNIIFPPIVGLAAGEHLWSAAVGFLLTGVGLPLVTVVALARVGGGLQTITTPIGKVAGVLLGAAVYLTIGPLFATPRTATVSFELGVAPFVGNSPLALGAYTVLYFGLTLLLALFPGKLVDTIGKLITPVLILALVVLGGAAFLLPAGTLSASLPDYQSSSLALGQGFVQGYQTMDALAALVFGIVIVNAIKDSGITDTRLHTRYTIIAAIIAATGLGLVYVSLIYLGATSGGLVQSASTGVQILTTYVQHTFGAAGMVLLAVVILLACLTTGVGLVSACGSYFSQLLPFSYRTVVTALCVFSAVVANQGLEQLIAVAVPVLVTVYPVAIALVALSLLSGCWKHARRVYAPVMAVALLLGLLDGAKAVGLMELPTWITSLPGAAMGMAWLTPVLAMLLLAATADRLLPARSHPAQA
ncbi:branched-chain amino acid transport system II carrier protein [Comamonas sp. CMM03]|uniref:branched-chain amino acid transport system II carrier protein n=1 Tax=Comamonas sp. CMM03 TaxID=2854781 RepID=UPI001C45E780|nr:branched-chain amino acid transport system II carrier protein [Comamonas sp. CMM03]MBV7418534.1 branched-chain amino acid transport system II carrier protein [Comamonas sp. CMM03]